LKMFDYSPNEERPNPQGIVRISILDLSGPLCRAQRAL